MERRRIAVRGIVQGVGFRPFVYRLARSFSLSGFVRNQTDGVSIEVEGSDDRLDAFTASLRGEAPVLARIDALQWTREAPRGERGFHIEASSPKAAASTCVAPDVATCDDCLADLRTPSDRRYRYPFVNCTNCGPRYTVVRDMPYDRARTTMAAFSRCASCREEYETPAGRWFHAQPIACPRCGPRLRFHGPSGARQGEMAFLEFARALREGKIGALKGLGGFHLTCDARDAGAVCTLRQRKHREEKAFALMVADLAMADQLCDISSPERDILASWRRPIVLMKRRPGARIAEAVAPRSPHLGVMLPYTPLHHLLLEALGGPLVMTSGNRSDEPIAYDDDDALARLAGIADVFLTHDRPIHRRCEDSVVRIIGDRISPIRRSRGYAPEPIPLPVTPRAPVLAVGGQVKSTFTITRDAQAFPSPHLGDLDDYAAFRSFESDIDRFQSLLCVRPRYLAHDLHPDYVSTHYARAHAEPTHRIAVQHHHAHMASCMAENGLVDPVIGVTWDGTGYGTDGAIWGGEFLVGDYRAARRAAHLRYVRMPGGSEAIRHPWRMALAHARASGVAAESLRKRHAAGEVRVIEAATEKGLNAPWTSSMGRLFDAVAALLGLRDSVSFEGQAALELEWRAQRAWAEGSYAFELRPDADSIEVDTRPLIRAVAEENEREVPPGVIARRFHLTLVEMLAAVCCRLRAATGIRVVVLSGGVFLNAILTTEGSARLAREGFEVYRHHLVPPNDGGLSLGQAAVAAARLAEGGTPCA